MKSPVETVSFTRMEDGTREEYARLAVYEEAAIRSLPDRLLLAMEQLDGSLEGFRISRLEHSLQSATRAYEAGEAEEMVVAALLHDIGDVLAPASHSELAAAILRPYVSERVHWIIQHHGLFQSYYYAHHYDRDRYARDRYARDRFRNHPWYQDCVDFCHHYDQNCFDPDYPSRSLEFFRPMVEQVMSEPKKYTF